MKTSKLAGEPECEKKLLFLLFRRKRLHLNMAVRSPPTFRGQGCKPPRLGSGKASPPRMTKIFNICRKFEEKEVEY